MQKIFFDTTIAEKEAKKRFYFEEGIMMENAATALEIACFQCGKTQKILILSGSGNNGADGLCLARRIFGKFEVNVILLGEPKTSEAKTQLKMAEATGVKITKIPFPDNDEQQKNLPKKSECNLDNQEISCLFQNASIIIDCLYGTGFHGTLNENSKTLISLANKSNAYKIACDIPSGIDKKGNVENIAFCADETITMGALKIALYSDKAKDFVGKITVANLGISRMIFESCAASDAFLLEENDIKLPIREKKSCHKGNFGHSVVILGEKCGAAIIAGTAALRFGAGLVTCLKSETKSFSNPDFFLMNPELMISETIPKKTNAILIGPGLGRNDFSQWTVARFEKLFADGIKNFVIDADFFYNPELKIILEFLNSNKDIQTILTPHPKELEILNFSTSSSSAQNNNNAYNERLELIHSFNIRFPNITLCAKGANTYIANKNELFICDIGTQSLAKAGSGDVLAGMCLSLLSQGYNSLDSAKTAVFVHAKKSTEFKENYSLSPLKLIEKL